MIDFHCHCGYEISVTQDLAGDVIQCPQCKRLNDIPLLSDLENIDESGNYKIEDAPAPGGPDRVAELTYVFTRDRHDADGHPIDLRQTQRQMDAITPPPIEKGAPKYDPVTGELIEVKADPSPDPSTLPIARRLRQAPKNAGFDLLSPLEVFAIPLRLLKPVNLIVMFFILLAQVIGQFMMTAIEAFYWILVPFWMILHALIIAHFANVIDETGPTNRNELPTPLRHLSWHDDTFGPFSRAIGALIICYSPAILLLMYLPMQRMMPLALMTSSALAIAGTIFFPAVLLTTVTSGSIANLRPDRIVGVAIACGAEYLISIFAWIIGGSLWLAGTVVVNAVGAVLLNSMITLPAHWNWGSGYGMLISGIFLLHFFCWHLGALYRRHHEEFPWAFQRHDRTQLDASPTGFPVAAKKSPRRVEV